MAREEVWHERGVAREGCGMGGGVAWEGYIWHERGMAWEGCGMGGVWHERRCCMRGVYMA